MIFKIHIIIIILIWLGKGEILTLSKKLANTILHRMHQILRTHVIGEISICIYQKTLAQKRFDLEIVTFMNQVRSLIFKIRRELKAFKFHVANISCRKRHCQQYEIIKRPKLISQIDENSKSSWWKSRAPRGIADWWGHSLMCDS